MISTAYLPSVFTVSIGKRAVPTRKLFDFEMVVQRVDDVFGRELAVTLVPLHALTQLDAPCQRIGVGPFQGEHRRHGVLGKVDSQQQVEDIVDDQPALDVVADDRAEIAELAAKDADPQVALALRDGGRPAGAEQKARAEGTRTEAAARDASAA